MRRKGLRCVRDRFSGSVHLSSACAQAGLRVGPPIDIKTGFDLNAQSGQQKVWEIITKQQPTVVFMAPVCTPWSQIQNINDQKKVLEKQRKVMPMVNFVAQVAKYQAAHGRLFLIENPNTSKPVPYTHLTLPTKREV